MRIISGIGKGVKLRTPPGLATRPTMERAKEALFSAIGDVSECIVVDLFAGSGALGLEAASRGAAKVIFFEIDRRAMAVLKSNLAHLLAHIEKSGMSPPEMETVLASAYEAPLKLSELKQLTNVIAIADPPYAGSRKRGTDTGAAELLMDAGIAEWLENGMLVLEHEHRQRLPWHPASPWRCLKTSRFGNCAISFAVSRSTD